MRAGSRAAVLALFTACATVAVFACAGQSYEGGGTGGAAGAGGAGGSGGIPGLRACSLNSDCIVVPQSCCGSCGSATREDALAVHKDKASAYRQSVCDGTGCPTCYKPTDPTLIATCAAGTCEVVDLSKHAATACLNASDCRVRTSACCECGGPTDDEHLIAISQDWELTALICSGQGCPECAPAYPPKTLSCQDGHCVIEKL